MGAEPQGCPSGATPVLRVGALPTLRLQEAVFLVARVVRVQPVLLGALGCSTW